MKKLLNQRHALLIAFLAVGTSFSLKAQTQLTIKKPMSEADYKEVQQILSGVDASQFSLKANVASTTGKTQAVTVGKSAVSFSKVSQVNTSSIGGKGGLVAFVDNFIVINKASSSQVLDAAKMQKLQAIANKYQ